MPDFLSSFSPTAALFFAAFGPGVIALAGAFFIVEGARFVLLALGYTPEER